MSVLPDARYSTFPPRVAERGDDAFEEPRASTDVTGNNPHSIDDPETGQPPRQESRVNVAPRPARSTRRKRARRPVVVARVLFTVALLVNVLGIGGVWALRAFAVEHSTLADLQVRIKHIKVLAAKVGSLQTATLADLQAELAASKSDLRTLDGLIPFSGALNVGGLGAYHRVLRLGDDAITTAQEGLAVVSLLTPPLLGFISTATHSQASTAALSAHLLTAQTVQDAQRHLAQAVQAWNDVLADRATISAADAAAINNPQVNQLLSTLDTRTASVDKGIELASALLDWSPRLFGLSAPFHVLLFDMDSDELRATGGFLGNYADLTLSGGALTSGVHLHDVYMLDCPSTDTSFGCPARDVPAQYSWFSLADGHFGLRDSNLDPDFPTSAGIATNLYQVESQTRVDGVIALTPKVVESILGALGSVVVKPFNVTVTADNLRSLLHYYHQNPQIGQQLGVSPTALGTTANKVFDVLASQAIFAKLGTMTSEQQAALGKSLLEDLKTKDIQIFVSNTRVENLLAALGVAGQVTTVSGGDSEFVVDTNDGGSYANADVTETVSDTVTLDGKGGASHALVVTHAFAQTQHDYVVGNEYDDLVRVIVPSNATHLQVSGPCTPESTIQAYHQLMACQIALRPGQSSALAFAWYVPAVTVLRNGATYQLLVQRQAGANVAVHVRVNPPTGSAIAFGAGPGTVAAGHYDWSAQPLTMDTVLAMVINT